MSDATPNLNSPEDDFDPHRFAAEPKKKFDKKIFRIVKTLGFIGLVIAGSIWFGKWQLTAYFDNMSKAREIRSEVKKSDTQPPVSRNEIVFPKLQENVMATKSEPAASDKNAVTPASLEKAPSNYAGAAIPVISNSTAPKQGSVPSIGNNSSSEAGTQKEKVAIPMMLPSVAVTPKEPIRGDIQPVQQVPFLPKGVSTLSVRPVDILSAPSELSNKPVEIKSASVEKPRTIEALAALKAAGSAISATAQSTSATVGDRSRVILRGSYIECVLESQLISNIPGITACVVPVNVYSDNGKRLLIRKGSKLVGEYSATVKLGDDRFGVMWQRIKTPDGVVIDVDSGATDSVGAMGLNGAFDSHWAQRLGSAFMFSIIADGISTALTPRSTAGPNGSQITQPSATVDTAQNIAKTQLEASLAMQPTFFKSRGDRISVFVNRDLWFQ